MSTRSCSAVALVLVGTSCGGGEPLYEHYDHGASVAPISDRDGDGVDDFVVSFFDFHNHRVPEAIGGVVVLSGRDLSVLASGGAGVEGVVPSAGVAVAEPERGPPFLVVGSWESLETYERLRLVVASLDLGVRWGEGTVGVSLVTAGRPFGLVRGGIESLRVVVPGEREGCLAELELPDLRLARLACLPGEAPVRARWVATLPGQEAYFAQLGDGVYAGREGRLWTAVAPGGGDDFRPLGDVDGDGALDLLVLRVGAVFCALDAGREVRLVGAEGKPETARVVGDLDGDGVGDVVLAEWSLVDGRHSEIAAFSTRTGERLWIRSAAPTGHASVRWGLDACAGRDSDGDGVGEVVAVFSEGRTWGVAVLSGRTGEVVESVEVGAER